MSALAIGGMVFVCLGAAAGFGMLMRFRLPQHHLSVDSRDVIKLATAVVGTLSALALGFLIASAKTTFDDAETELRTSTARVLLLDRVMIHYGPETAEARRLLSQLVESRLQINWPAAADGAGHQSRDEISIEPIQDQLRSLKPGTDAQRLLQARAIEVSGDIAEAHWLVVESDGESLPIAFLVILAFWLALLFFTFGLLSPVNSTVVCMLIVCALSVGGAVFLIIDMAHPYLGVIQVSEEPLRNALSRLSAHTGA
ncbi:DUF4239 domain-containing protein [Rhizobium sp. P32RR-XVIII]|uniref:bestrophin-like domain n=1 Tax=Rhizobium sp. P32RR-XVIII TaxID=2726738 RepID=UPI0014568176|nr:DUF4239 domain-containing protein [Rhizobium sp. P32RR-XVIII]NLS08159.1 DUF4239 domain-containing protein [Rhizobium sp. P32RR-XVIII]